MTDPLDVVEMRNALANLAVLSRTFYENLRSEGFDRKESLALTQTWMTVTLTNVSGGGENHDGS